MKSLNEVKLIGRIGTDLELRKVGNDTSVLAFTLATNKSYKDRDGKLVEKTDWHNIVAWGKIADQIVEMLKKGSKVFIGGSLSTRSYEDKENITRYITEITADNWIALDNKVAEEVIAQ